MFRHLALDDVGIKRAARGIGGGLTGRDELYRRGRGQDHCESSAAVAAGAVGRTGGIQFQKTNSVKTHSVRPLDFGVVDNLSVVMKPARTGRSGGRFCPAGRRHSGNAAHTVEIDCPHRADKLGGRPVQLRRSEQSVTRNAKYVGAFQARIRKIEGLLPREDQQLR